ncbi:MAG TPA: hypothetical protein VGC39_01755, partial [Candidatus Methylacidiphilales bacterium]
SLGKKVLEGSLDSLLTEHHSTQINIPADLSAEQQQRLRVAIGQAGLAEGDIQFTRPHLSLEQLYLRTVQQQADLAANPSSGK